MTATKRRIVAKEVCKSFASPVPRDVDLEIPPGCIHGLVGENGAGKTTLAKIIIGLESADAGSLLLDGRPYRPTNTADSLGAGVAICAQELSLVDDLSIAENILLPTSALARIRRKSAHERAAELLEMVGLEHASPGTRVGRLSLAEKQLVEIAKTLATDAKLLILDEPTSARVRSPVIDGPGSGGPAAGGDKPGTSPAPTRPCCGGRVAATVWSPADTSRARKPAAQRYRI